MIVDKALQARFEAGNPVRHDWCWLYGSRDCQSNYQIGAGEDGTGGSLGTWMELSEPMLKLALRMFMLRLSWKMPLPGQYAVTDDAMLLCQADGIDALIEVTAPLSLAPMWSRHRPPAHHPDECGTRRWVDSQSVC